MVSKEDRACSITDYLQSNRNPVIHTPSHMFLNFSKRINGLISMKKPVDIQLGISCGRSTSHSSLPFFPYLPSKSSEQYTNSIGVNHRQSNNKQSTEDSYLLDQLVADVLIHIESCTDNIGYSSDLDYLKPKLLAYKMARHPINSS
ncbi:hypothetical protein BDB01DRAFT_831485 [Pilobolus umbonatus]|nr:hypothetical protein BDB01DRAFT_831485 [Pilobolus umbonatus]